MNKRVNALYFSATDTTKEIVNGIANKISANIGGESVVNQIDFTLPAARKNAVSFTADDLVIVGIPVYAGRVPNILLKYLDSITGNGALAVAVVVYGNRDYDDALLELKNILVSRGFMVIAGGAFIGEHSFSKTLGGNRPDVKDMAIAEDFAEQILAKINTADTLRIPEVKGNYPYRSYYVPKDKNDEPVNDFRKITPKTNDLCIDCKLCVEICPMGSIDVDDVSILNGICIKCCACVKKCPVQAKFFDDENYLKHKYELELEFADRKEPELFI